jgi:3-phenylpropionate/cinnamic acid dioxygenase small subunit
MLHSPAPVTVYRVAKRMTDRDDQITRLLLKQEIEEFLYHEAELLDERRYEDWLALVAEDVRYWMPMRRNVKVGEQEREFTPPIGEAAEVAVKCRFLIYRNRVETETDILVGKREDRLRRVGDSWQIARRKIILDQNVLLTKNLTFFF